MQPLAEYRIWHRSQLATGKNTDENRAKKGFQPKKDRLLIVAAVALQRQPHVSSSKTSRSRGERMSSSAGEGLNR